MNTYTEYMLKNLPGQQKYEKSYKDSTTQGLAIFMSIEGSIIIQNIILKKFVKKIYIGIDKSYLVFFCPFM